MSSLRLLAGRLRQDRLPAMLLAVGVLATAFLAAAAPRLLNAAADAGLRHEIRGAGPLERNLRLGQITRLGSDADAGMSAVGAAASSQRERLPDSVRGLISGESASADSIVWSIPGRPTERPGFLTLRFQDGLEDRLRLVTGVMPSGEVRRVATDPPSNLLDPPDTWEAPLFEVALSSATADALGAEVGDRLDVVPDTDDPLTSAAELLEPLAVEVVGVYEVIDLDGDFWMGDLALDRPSRVPVGINTVLIYATALAAPEAYPELLQLGSPIRYTFRYAVDPDRLDAGMLDGLALDLRRMESTYPSFASSPDPDRTTLQTGLLGLADRFLAERRTAEAVLVTASMGPAAVALVAIGVLAVLIVHRRRRTLLVVGGRGGSAFQIAGSHLAEGALLAVAPAALAAWAATVAVDARDSPATPLAAAVVALGTILILVGAALPTALSPLRALDREETADIGAGPRRLAFEALVVVLAVGGVVLLRQRGLAGGSAAGALEGVDPFLAAVPALVGLAVGILTVRLYPLPIRLAGVLAAGARGLVPALGLRRAERQSGAGHLPLVVLLLTVAIGTFSSTMLATIERGQVDASWQAVGAAHRVASSESLPAALDVSSIDGVEAVAGVHEADASLGLAGGTRVALVAVDPVDYVAVNRGTPAETPLPRAFLDAVGEERPGTSGAPIPAIVSAALARSSTTPLAVGETFQLTIAARFATFVVSEVRREMPTLPAERAFVVVPRELLAAGLIDRALPTTSLFVRAPASSADALRDAVAQSGASARVESQATRLASQQQRPLVQAVGAGFGLALGIAVAYAALAVTIALLLAGTARARETAQLRTLGLGRGQIVSLAVLEHGPPVIVALGAGLALGVGVGWLVLPGLGLGAFVGSASDPTLQVDTGQLFVLIVVLALIVAVGVAVAAWTQRRADPAQAARAGSGGIE